MFAILTVFAASAQFSGGVKAGLNMSSAKFEADGFDEKYSGIGFHVGVYGSFSLTDALSVQPELIYNSLSFDTGDDFGDDTKASYLSIPVMLKYGFADNMFNVQVGPQIGVLLSTDPSDFKDDGLKSTDFTLNIGAGVNFGKFNGTVRYGIGLSNNAGDVFTDLSDDFSIKNNNFQISLGYQLFGE